jgi:hypothetical protein
MDFRAIVKGGIVFFCRRRIERGQSGLQHGRSMGFAGVLAGEV